jgi:16S rRNA (guanine(966)-N(2))-methyltransferase RsmD
VISGERKGHRLIAPKGRDVRPTEDRVKESLFNIISPISSGAVILDLFAGTGGIGIEFLSRGASFTYFVDRGAESISVIKKNLEHTKYLDKSEIIVLDARVAIQRFAAKETKFDYIYIDPPYNQTELFHEVLQLISDSGLLKENGLAIVEHDKRLALKDSYGDIMKFDERSYGSKLMTYYKPEEVH